MSVLDKVRRWIDGESSELVLEEAARDAQIKPRSKAEEFIVKIAREVENVMQREMVPLPQGTTLIPTEYIIFLSEDDDKDWQGAKRRGLEQGLFHILSERSKEIAGKKKLKTKSFAIELRVDGTLEKGDITVQHGWAETRNDKTDVFARHKPDLNQVPKPEANPAPAAPNFTQNPSTRANQQPTSFPQNSPPPPAIAANEREELTRVNSRAKALYTLEVWQNNIRQNSIPIYQSEIVIGRGSKSKPVDIALTGDPEVSRRHVVLILDQSGNYSLINEGRNPALINNTELPLGQRISVSPGQPIMVCSYMIRIRIN